MGLKGIGRAGAAALLAASLIAPAPATLARGAPPKDPLAAGFADPPNGARPRVWWHWMNGNVTEDGIAKDLAWMARVGIGGLQNFDVDLLTPQVVEKRLVYMSPEWKHAFRYAAQLAEQKGLEFAIASSPGWSETGGPWVAPQDAMKKLVWSETLVDGGAPVGLRLPQPPGVTGPFADLPEQPGLLATPDPNAPQAHGEAAVVAYRLPDGAAPAPPPRMTAAGASLDAALLTDGQLARSLEIPRGTAEAPAQIVIDYPAPVTVRSLVLAMTPIVGFGTGGPGVKPQLQADDGHGGWRPVADADLLGPQTTVSFAPVTGARFRVTFTPVPPGPPVPWGIAPGAQILSLAGPTPKTLTIHELRLSADPRINRVEAKAGFAVAADYYRLDEGLKDEAGVPISDVVDLSGKMAPDGTLDWAPPSGRWTVLRFGWSLTGTTNHPTTKEASGLEVDKLDAAAVRRYLETYLANYRDAAGQDLIGAHGVRALLTDSIEVGAANWTPGLIAQFQRLRGYDPRPWLPALTGVVVGSRAQSDGFLYDWRRTLADLLASEHYGTIAKVAHEHGLKVYGEALEDGRPMLGDDLTMRSHADTPMAALWTYRPETGPRQTYVGDIRGAASVAHVYGQNVVAAESMTAAYSPWAFAPHDLKRFIDLEFALGVNRPVIHTSVHQPLDDKQPGFSLWIFGQYFNRHETWAQMARPWVDYMARSGFLLQQGRNVADVAYFIGEERPLTQLFQDRALPDLPRGYAHDFVDADIVLTQLSVRGGEIVSPGGARYRALYLGGDARRMTLPVLRRIAALVEAGATVIGRAPEATPSRADDPQAFAALARRLWAGGAVTRVGRGRVVAGDDPDRAMASLGVGPDLAFDGPAAEREVLFLHRRLADGDVYFLDNSQDRAQTLQVRFRVAGKAPEVWRAETGRAEPVSYRREGGTTRVDLAMKPFDAVFVVFRKPARARSAEVTAPAWPTAQTLGGGWDVAFQPGRGAPAAIHLDRLASLSESVDPGVKYFSGVATYRTRFTAAALRPGQRARLDLGAVGDVAEATLNGKPLGTAWNAPFALDATAALRPGENVLEVKVADLWVNRLIGDRQPGARPVAFTTAPTYNPDAPLRPSGLIGPVRLETTTAPR